MKEILLLAFGAIFGLLAGQGSEVFRLWREEKRAIGRALKTLLVIRQHLYSLRGIKDLTTKYLNLPDQQMVQFQYVMQAFILPNTIGMLGKYEEAIDTISGVKPLLGFSIAQKTQLIPMIMVITQIGMQDEQSSTIWLSMEAHLSNLPDLDDLILELAERHSIDLHDDIKRNFEESLTLPPYIENFIKENAKAIKNSNPPQNQEI